MSNLVPRRGSAVDIVDTAIGVAVAIVAAVIVLKLLGWVLGTVFFLFKVAIVAVIAAVIINWVSGRRHR